MRRSLFENEKAFDKFKIRPRILTDVSTIDTSITLFGQDVSFASRLVARGDSRSPFVLLRPSALTF
jgi:hypothetical protein